MCNLQRKGPVTAHCYNHPFDVSTHMDKNFIIRMPFDRELANECLLFREVKKSCKPTTLFDVAETEIPSFVH